MNLELIQEINTLKDENKSYTEIAELTGIARTSIILSIRLSKIFNTAHSQQISSLKKDIKLLKSTIAKYKDSSIQTVAEIKKLNALIDIDDKRDILVKKDEFIEIFIDTPLEVCEKRDPKGLYKKARNGNIPNFTGISSPYEVPYKAEIHIKTDILTLSECVNNIVKYLNNKGYLGA